MFGVDDLLLGALSVGGSLFKNSSDNERQERTNQFNAREAALAREFNAEQAQINRDFQERLSNSAFQRGMADMAKAGLNPILAYQKGGASSPTGATAATAQASGVSPKETADVVGSAVSTAQHNRRLAVELENMKIQNNLIHAQTAQSISAANVNDSSARKLDAETAIRKAELSPAELHAVESQQRKEVLQNSAGRIANQAGYSANLVKPAADVANTAVKTMLTPFAQRFHF